MKIFSIIITTLFIFIHSLYGQVDQVSIGPGYSQQAYYSLSTGEVEVVANDAWDISFSAIGQQDAGVFFNESASLSASALQIFEAEATQWEEVTTNTDTYTEDVALQNPDLSWSEGAFNVVKDSASPFDYGWGVYNPQNNKVEGTKIFIIKKRNGSFIKFQVESLQGDLYTIRYADLAGDNERVFEISKSDSVKGMVYFSFATDSIVDMPSEFDLIFKRYTTPLDAGDGTFIEYTVSGVMIANDVQAVVVDNVDPTEVNEVDYADQYSASPTVIGHEWKSFDFAEGWVMDVDRTHFVKTAIGDIYQLTFYDFEGSSTGTTTLERTFITSVSTNEEVSDNLGLSIYPNPTTDYLLISSAEQRSLEVIISDVSGRSVIRIEALTNEKIDMSNVSNGIYNVTIRSADEVVTKRLVVR